MDFLMAVSIILSHEGGYINSPLDPGGETRFGISKRSFPDIDIKNLTKGHAKHLYESHYWVPMKCEGLPENLRLAAFDCAVNQGVNFATRALQHSAKLRADGVIGPKTLSAINNMNQGEILTDFMQRRLVRYMKNRNFDIYGKGWLLRLIDISIKTQRYKIC